MVVGKAKVCLTTEEMNKDLKMVVKRILALPTWRQKCTVPELQPFLSSK